jgi:beta-glucosidase
VRGSWLAAAALILALWPSGASAAGRCGTHPWCETSLSPDRRAALLLDALTPAERIGLLGGDDAGGVLGLAGTHTGTEAGVPRVGLPPIYLTDGPVGVREGEATALPSSMALAASFDRAMARAHGTVVGVEALFKGNDVAYAPTVNLLRTPLWGRAFESMGEDPLLTGQLGAEWILGLQSRGLIANVKHFAVNNQEDRRFTVDARVDERTLFELYLPQFEAAVRKGRAGSVMCAYNRLNGPHACESRWLLDRVLRQRWGFRGFVLADYGASKRVGSALRAGLDFEPFPYVDFDGGENLTPTAVTAALEAGRTTRARVDTAVRRILRTLFAYGFFDRRAHPDDESRIDRVAHAREARRLAEAGTVLLKNDGALPLRGLDSLAVIGADGDAYKNGGGSSNVRPYSLVTPRSGIAARAGPGVEVRYDPGTDLEQAAATARGADAAVVVVADTAGETADKPCLALDCGAEDELQRDRLVDAVAQANRRTIVVLETAGPVLTPWRDRVEAIVEAWYPGSAGGTAIARVLFGDVDPGGRLPATFPRRERDLPTAAGPRRYPGVDDVVRYDEGVLVGYRWFDERGIAPAFPFGHGLSYARFAFRGFRAQATRRGLRASVEVVNTGRRAGTAVPQLYVGLPGARGRVQPPRQLKGFESVTLRPGRRARVSFRLGSRALSWWNARGDRWEVAPGCYRVVLGRSSRDVVASARVPIRGGRC